MQDTTSHLAGDGQQVATVSDRELLEAAARAIGLNGEYDEEMEAFRCLPGKHTPYGMAYSYWNPLTDDGEALRLAARLEIGIDFRDDGSANACYVFPMPDRHMVLEFEPRGSDAAAATRRAIVRCAAAIEQHRNAAMPSHE